MRVTMVSVLKRRFACTYEIKQQIDSHSNQENDGRIGDMSKDRYIELTNDITNWSFIPLNEDDSVLGTIDALDIDMDLRLEDREEVRKMCVTALANRMFRYHAATLALIRKYAPTYSPTVYIRQEMFAEKILSLAYRINISPLPVHIMSANAIKHSFDLECMDVAEFVEKMAFYDESYVVYEHEKPTHDISSIMVVHKSSKCSKTIKVCYRTKKDPRIHD